MRLQLPTGQPARLLHRVTHIELNWMRGPVGALDIDHFQLDVRVDHFVGEHAAPLWFYGWVRTTQPSHPIGLSRTRPGSTTTK
jgi:hypothetical protein